MAPGPLGFPKNISEGQGQTYLHGKLLPARFAVLTFALIVNEQRCWNHISTVVQTSVSSPPYARNDKNASVPRGCPWWGCGMVHFVHLNTEESVFKGLCDDGGRTTESTSAAHRRRKIVSTKNLYDCFSCELNEPLYSWSNIVYLKEELENYNYPDLGICQIFSWKWMRWACRFKKNSDSLYCHWLNWSFQRFKLKKQNLSPSHWAWKLPNNERFFSCDQWTLNKCVLLYCTVKCVTIGKICITQWTNIVQMINIWSIKSHMSKKST